ncbi:MAG: AmmeMemoRadiSam system protein B [Bryobacterales bacterium]|nr:AmmeMemoRadiSam system protein B [Bryobacterales bacterium]
MDLDFQPSPVEENPGLLIRDCLHFSDTTLLIPNYLLRFLRFFDGCHTRGQLVEEIARSANRETAAGLEAHLFETLDSAGFLESESFLARREAVLEEFRRSPVRTATHAGSAYPGTAEEIRAYFDANLRIEPFREDPSQRPMVGIAAPHISFEGGWSSYSALASALRNAAPDSLFVVMGTSHYGERDQFGLTAKAFETPLGTTRTEPDLAKRLAEASPAASIWEDYCHAVDHSLEFHVLLLQHLVRPDVRVLPILVGGFGSAMRAGTAPEANPALARLFSALRDLAQEEGRKLFWLLSVDMAHMGERYGDEFAAQVSTDAMAAVEEIDRARVAMLEAGDAGAFWDDVVKRDAELKWCGSSTLYAFTQVYPDARARLLHYEQWNIDPASVVSFGALAFHREAPPETA